MVDGASRWQRLRYVIVPHLMPLMTFVGLIHLMDAYRVFEPVRRQEATHTGEFMGIPATGKRVTVRYMDFWKVVSGKIQDNWVMIDVIDVMRQLGVDPLNGKGWDDRGENYHPIE